MRKLHLVFLCGIFLGLFLACSASAVPSFRGYTGLVIIPTSDTLDKGEFNAGIMNEDYGNFTVNNAFANFGVADNFEVGCNSFKKNENDPRETLLNAKYTIFLETNKRAGLACGLIDLTNEIESTAYVVASKTLVRGINMFEKEVTSIRGHVGIGGGQFKGLFLGASAFAGTRVMFSLEWDSQQSNAGFRFTPFRGLRLHAALFDIGGKDNFGLGASFTKTF